MYFRFPEDTEPVLEKLGFNVCEALCLNSSNEEGLNTEFDRSKAHQSRKLALLPDFRSKTLHLASIVDINATKEMITGELLYRLVELLQPIVQQHQISIKIH